MDWWFFPFFAGLLCQLPDCLLPLALSDCLQLLPSSNEVKSFLRPPSRSLSLHPRSLTQLYAYFEKLLQISSLPPAPHPSSPWNSGSCVEGGREWDSSLETRKHWLHALYAVSSNLIKCWFISRLFFFWWERDFCFVLFFWFFFSPPPLENGSVSFSLMPIEYLWSKEDQQHRHIPPGKGPWVSEGLLGLRLRNLALLISRTETIKDLQTPSLFQASCQSWAVATFHGGRSYLSSPILWSVC